MKNFFINNRAQLIATLKGGLVVVTAYSGMQRSNDTAFAFEQEANFWWLSGIEVADWWLIIDGVRGKAWLVAPVISKVHEQFDGSLSPEDALKISGVDGVISESEAEALLRNLAKKHSVVHTLGKQPYAEYLNFTLNSAPKKLHETLTRIFNSVQDCRKELSQLRAIKQPIEIAYMKQAINLTVDAFKAMKENLPRLKYEYEIEAELTHYVRSRGATGHAFDPIVASGENACTLHYIKNNAKLKRRELVLLDIGVRHHGYASDIARTYAYGEPTKRQRDVYNAIKSAHITIIKLLKPGLSVEQYQQDTDAIMADTLVSLGLMKGRSDQQNYRRYFPNAISHGLGIDTHDSLGAPHFFKPGMVLTVEPGVYIPEEGIGVRIEDDILISDTGHTNLSARLSTDL